MIYNVQGCPQYAFTKDMVIVERSLCASAAQSGALGAAAGATWGSGDSARELLASRHEVLLETEMDMDHSRKSLPGSFLR